MSSQSTAFDESGRIARATFAAGSSCDARGRPGRIARASSPRRRLCTALATLAAARCLLARAQEGFEPILVRRKGDDQLWDAPNISDALSPTCSLEHVDDMAPALIVPSISGRTVSFPRGRNKPGERTYAGLGMWDSRGIDMRGAVLAMLGDTHALYESPTFTVFKLLSLGLSHLLPQAIWPSTGNPGMWEEYDSPNSYSDLYSQVTWRAFSDAAMARFPRAQSEAEAVEFAKAAVDDIFADVDAFAEMVMMPVWTTSDPDSDAFWNLAEPSPLLFSSMSRRTAVTYGLDENLRASVLVLAPEARRRGCDGGYFRLWREVVHYCSSAAMTPEAIPYSDMCDCEYNGDFGEVFSPGYHLPGHVEGLELPSGHAMFKTTHVGRAHVAILTAGGECIIAAADGVGFVRCAEPACDTEEQSCGADPVIPTTPAVAVPATGVLYAVLRGESPAEAQRRGADARELLRLLNADVADDSREMEAVTGNGIRAPAPAPVDQAHEPAFLLALRELEFIDRSAVVRAVFVGPDGRLIDEALTVENRPGAADVLALRGSAPVR